MPPMTKPVDTKRSNLLSFVYIVLQEKKAILSLRANFWSGVGKYTFFLCIYGDNFDSIINAKNMWTKCEKSTFWNILNMDRSIYREEITRRCRALAEHAGILTP